MIIKKDEDTGEYYFDVNDLRDLFEDASIIDQYSMETRDDGSIIIEFFDTSAFAVIEGCLDMFIPTPFFNVSVFSCTSFTYLNKVISIFLNTLSIFRVISFNLLLILFDLKPV